MDLLAEFSELFPISSGRFSLELVPESVDQDTGEVYGGLHDDGRGVFVTLRTIGWDVEGEQRSIRDVREQQVFVLSAEHRDDPRLPACLAGWAQALRFVLAQHDELAAVGELPRGVAEALEFAMPSDLLFADVLDLRRPKTADDFTEALLSSKKRLGRFLP